MGIKMKHGMFCSGAKICFPEYHGGGEGVGRHPILVKFLDIPWGFIWKVDSSFILSKIIIDKVAYLVHELPMTAIAKSSAHYVDISSGPSYLNTERRSSYFSS